MDAMCPGMVCRPLWSKLMVICAIYVQLLIGIIMDTLKLCRIKYGVL